MTKTEHVAKSAAAKIENAVREMEDALRVALSLLVNIRNDGILDNYPQHQRAIDRFLPVLGLTLEDTEAPKRPSPAGCWEGQWPRIVQVAQHILGAVPEAFLDSGIKETINHLYFMGLTKNYEAKPLLQVFGYPDAGPPKNEVLYRGDYPVVFALTLEADPQGSAPPQPQGLSYGAMLCALQALKEHISSAIQSHLDAIDTEKLRQLQEAQGKLAGKPKVKV